MIKNTHQRFTIAFLAGAPGSGKSYCMALDVVDRLTSSDAKIITNVPLDIEAVSKRAAGLKGDPAEYAARIELLDLETLRGWRDGTSGPWELASRAQGHDLLLDEVHLYCPSTGADMKPWQSWLGEARHEGWRRIVFMTQDEAKVGKPIKEHAELRYELTSTERLRDPLLKIPMSSWAELLASITGTYEASVLLDEYRRTGGKMRRAHRERFVLQSDNFKLYDSYSKPGGGTTEGSNAAPVREHEKRPSVCWKDRKAPVWAWFLSRHHGSFYIPFAITAVLGWLCFGGGLPMLMTMAANAPRTMATTEAVAQAEVEKPKITLAQIEGSLSDEYRTQLRSILAGAVADRDDMRAEITRLEDENADLLGAELITAKLVGINGPKSFWSTGEVLRAGEAFEDDNDTKINSVDRENRRVVVGTEPTRVVRLGGVYNYRRRADDREPKLARAVPPPAPGRKRNTAEIVGGEKSILVGRSDADGAVRPDPERPDRR